MASTALISLEDYLANVYDPDCEYVDGVLLERNVGESDHAGLQGLLTASLFSLRQTLHIHVISVEELFRELDGEIEPPER